MEARRRPQSDARERQVYSLSRQLLALRSGYYDCLNAAQRGDLDVTAWVSWSARQCTAAYESASQVIDKALEKRHFWDRHEGSGLNNRQRKSLQRLLDAGDGGFEGGMNAEKYIKMRGDRGRRSQRSCHARAPGRGDAQRSAQATRSSHRSLLPRRRNNRRDQRALTGVLVKMGWPFDA